MTLALEISKLQAWYGESHILHDVNLSVAEGEVVTLLGRNGAGRTTTLRAIMGLTGRREGRSRSMVRKRSLSQPIASRIWAWAIAPRSARFFPPSLPRKI